MPYLTPSLTPKLRVASIATCCLVLFVLASGAVGQQIIQLPDLNQGPNDSLPVLIAGPNVPGVDYDQYQILGNATLEGRVELEFIDGYQPAVGDAIQFLEAKTIEQQFRSYFFPITPPDNVAVEFERTINTVTAHFVSPRFDNAYTGFQTPSQWQNPENWTLGETPRSTNSLVLSNDNADGARRLRVTQGPADGFQPAVAHEVAIRGGAFPMIVEVSGNGQLSSTVRTTIEQEGRLELIEQGSLFTGELLVGPKATVLMDNGRIQTGANPTQLAGMFQGTGQVIGGLEMLPGGLLEVQSPAGARGGVLTIRGDYTQSAGSKLSLDLPSDNLGEYERLMIEGTASFDGVLELDFTGFEDFGVGTLIEQVVHAEDVGQGLAFRRIEMVGLPPGVYAGVKYHAGSYYASVYGHSVGDMDGDDDFDQDDVDLFVLALRDREAYELTSVGGGAIIGIPADITGDTDLDGDMDFDDIDDMIALLDGSAAIYAQQVLLGITVPEPGSFSLLALACLAAARCRRS